MSSPTTALAAIAAVTKQIRLSSAVSVLSSDDPVRVFEQFAHVDLISGGRAEIMAGRGSFIESFPLFGYDLGDYDELFAEKLELLLAIRDNERVTWQGKHRAPLEDAVVWPRPVQDPLPDLDRRRRQPRVRGAGGKPRPAAGARDHRRPDSPLQALRRSLPPGLGGDRPGRRAADRHQHPRVRRSLAPQAEAAFAAPYLDVMNRIGRERGWPPSGRAELEALAAPPARWPWARPRRSPRRSSRSTSSSEPERYLAHIGIGAVSHADVMRAIELFGTQVAPIVESETRRAAEVS